jgi:hypothetical protein
MYNEQVTNENTATTAEAVTDVTEKKPRGKADIDTSIKLLEKKLAQAKALKAQKEAAIKFAEKKIERRDIDRRKYLVGAYILAKLKGNELKSLYADLRSYYKRDAEKKLFKAPDVSMPIDTPLFGVEHPVGQEEGTTPAIVTVEPTAPPLDDVRVRESVDRDCVPLSDSEIFDELAF